MLPAAQLLIKNGERVEKGTQLVPRAPCIPRTSCASAASISSTNYLVKEVLKPYRSQGVDINDKHIEVICRQMMRRVKVEESGDSQLLSGSTISLPVFEDACDAVRDAHRRW